ncbi:7TM diverse intracellular signaling domain-containing protein [Bernardetia sp. OM2101]|uniref:7TM diverse intracellular signaling domain-containing protein n=1 Tax=Bernardetia sp. OM2101 TaxID=3344876 RepID=UPI0035D10753
MLKASFIVAQTPYVWQEKDVDEIKGFEILFDKNYTFEQVLNDSNLFFQENPKYYKFEKEDYCWFRFSIQNNSVYTKEGYIILIPEIDNTLYYYDFENQKWSTKKAGIAITDFKRRKGYLPIVLQSKQKNIFYIKSKVKELHSQDYPIKLTLYVKSKVAHKKGEQFVIVSWLVTCFAILLFIIYNLYIFLVFRDKTYLYYIIMILGSVLYITHFSEILNFILPFNFYNIQIQPNGLLYSYSLPTIINLFFIWILLFGYIQFARTYLQLSTYLKKWDKILKYILTLFSLYSVFFLVLSSFKSSFLYFWLASILNLSVGLIILLICYITILSYRKGYKLGRYFLIANLFPLLIIFIIAIYLLIYKYNTQPIQLLPHIALIFQTVTFAIALVARINLLKDDLKEKQLQAETLKKENDKMLARNRYIELENEYIISEMAQEVNQNTDLKQKLESNQRELTANTLYLYQKNEMLASLQKQIQNLSFKDTTTQNREGIREIKSTIKNDSYLENDWDKFKIHFEEVHPNFFRDLKEKYPTLTPNEIRLSAYYHLNMSAKEIATLLNINPTSVHRAKSRLNKKMEKLAKEN